MILSVINRARLYWAKRMGLQIPDDCRLIGMPKWGTEPYLISIGHHVTISGNVTFINHDGGTWVFRDQPRYRNVIKFGRITIHDNCFIGYGAIILPNVSIGPNAVIAAGAVVARDVPPGTVAGGVPAAPIMSVSDYAERALATTPQYSISDYKENKTRELLRLYPRPW